MADIIAGQRWKTVLESSASLAASGSIGASALSMGYARIVGIVDSYDAITSPRPYAEARSPSEAVSILYDARDRLFQAQLIEQFIQAVGVYPTGTLVQLSTKEIGVVISQNTARRLRPVVMLVADHEQNLLPKSEVIDLLVQQQDSAGNSLSITRSLKSGEFGIDTKMLQVSGM